MPTLEQLAQVVAANPPDPVLLEQNGETCVVSVGTLLEPVQPRLTLASGVLLGRASIGPGGPEPIGVGDQLAIQNGQLVLNVNGLAPVDSPVLIGTLSLGTASSQLGFFGATARSQPVVTGSRAGNSALASLISALAELGLISDGSTT
jgi:hypothetical protein